jgi:hypothetical protein
MKQGQTAIGFVFFLVAFIFIWAIFLSKYLSVVGQVLLETSAETGLLAFIYANLNLLVLLGVILITSIGMVVAQN